MDRHSITMPEELEHSPVEAEESLNKGYGNSTTLAKDIDTLEEADHVLISLSEMVASRLRRDHVRASCICVEIKGIDFRRHPIRGNCGRRRISPMRFHGLRENWIVLPPIISPG